MKKWGLILCVILFSQCKENPITPYKPNPDFTGKIYKTDYGLSIKLYPEYKKVKEEEGDVLFSSESGSISIIVFKENVIPIKKFYSLKEATSTFTLLNCEAYLFEELEKVGFRSLTKARLEIFPREKEIQITILAYDVEKKYHKIIDMLSTIKIE